MSISGFRRVDQARRYPTVASGIVSTAGVKVISRAAVDVTISGPDNHLRAVPDGGVIASSKRRIGGARCCPAICSRVISPTGVAITVDAVAKSAPDNHLSARPDGGVKVSSLRRICRAGCCPAVCSGIVSPAGVKITADVAKFRPRQPSYCRSRRRCDSIAPPAHWWCSLLSSYL